MKILHVQGFSDEERREKATEIKRNIFEAIQDITRFMPLLHPPVHLADDSNEKHLDVIHKINLDETDDFTDEAYDSAKILWEDEGVQESYRRSHEYHLIDCAKYFLDEIDIVRDPDFIPTDQDVLHARRTTTEIQKIEFTVRIASRYGGGTQSFWMFDVGGQRGERRKWIQVFDGISAVLFLVASSGFNTKIREDNYTNRLTESLRLFEEVWASKYLSNSGFILFLNKQDILKQKIESGARMEDYFPDFENYYPQNLSKEDDPNDPYTRARYFIRDKFLAITKKIFDRSKRRQSSTRGIEFEDSFFNESMRGRDCFCHFTTATDTNNIKRVFDDVHTMIIMNNLKMISIA